jgi:acyl-CoA synthetase (AMP-forming)/AMP-acid ligase II
LAILYVCMKMQLGELKSLRTLTEASGLSSTRYVADCRDVVRLINVASSAALPIDVEQFRGKSVVLSSHSQLVTVLALLELDGVAGRIVLCPPDIDGSHIASVLREGDVDAVVSDGTGPIARQHCAASLKDPTFVFASLAIPSSRGFPQQSAHPGLRTEWVLFTSGTAGPPKLAVHTLESLVAPVPDPDQASRNTVWGTFYDVRRYGGLQILLRALIGGGSMVLSEQGEPVAEFLGRLGQAAVTRISGTPSHWRRALMTDAARQMSPQYVRLSGEIVDQAVLDSLAIAYPDADIAHAYASTEAGVGFEVSDALAGFPAEIVGSPGEVDIRVKDGMLYLRSSRTAVRYLGDHAALRDDDGFVGTGDMVDIRNERYHFVGRRQGIINVGGQKVHPEEVEAIIHQQPFVRMARVCGRRNPITGAVVVAEILVDPSIDQDCYPAIRTAIVNACRTSLPPHKVPTLVRIVSCFELSEAGKISRSNA